MTESTADVYTREKRNVVTAIWTKVADKVNSLKMTLGRERREDLNQRWWMQTSGARDRRLGPHDAPYTPPMGEGSPQPDQVTPAPLTRGILWRGADNGLYSDPPPEGDPADQDYSYQVISSNTVRGPEKQFRVHLLTVEGFCLGCGWRPRSAQMTVLTPGEYWANPTGYGKCARCFAKGDLPKSWFVSRLGTVDIPDLEVDTESSATSGSETDDSVDTQSEADAVPLPKVLPVESI